MNRLPAMLFAVLVLAGCGGSATPSPSFDISAAPDESPAEVRAAIPGQQTSFLVSIIDSGAGAEAVALTATATHATVDRIVPATIKKGQVAEVWLTIDPTLTTDSSASLTIKAARGAVTRTVERSIVILPMSSEGRERDAQPHFAYWTRWLETNHPELGIDATTRWQPVFVSTLLVVSHMSYFSDNWEMGLAWHAGTVPPYDWSQIYLRRRGAEMTPSMSFKLDSFSAKTAPYPMAPPESVVR